jgi:hypothetical protein
LRGERDDVRGQRVLVGSPARHLALRRTMLPQNTAGEAFRDLELLPDVIDAATATGGAQ